MDTFTIYLMGPMSYRPQFNFPRFDEIAEDCRTRLTWEGKQIIVFSPAELDDPKVRAEALASSDGKPGATEGTWGDFLSRDLKLIADGRELDGVHYDIEGLIGMEDWWLSSGARTESFNGRVLKRPLIRYTPERTLRLCNEDEISKAHYLNAEELALYNTPLAA